MTPNIDFTTLEGIGYKSTKVSSTTPTISITSGNTAGIIMVFANGRVNNAGDYTVSITATNVIDPAGGEGATKGTGYSQVCASPFIAQMAPNTTSTVTINFESKTGDWRCITVLWIPMKGTKVE